MAVSSKTEQWSSPAGFMFAAIGFSVGLGNIWRFPYVMGENGGSAFFIVYLVCAFAIALPLLVIELAIGREGRGSAAGSVATLAKKHGLSEHWSAVGGLAIFGVFLIMSYYTVIAGWTLDYFLLSMSGKFNAITSEQSSGIFKDLMASPFRLLFWHTVVIILVITVLRRGVQAGVEKVARLLMPILFISLAVFVAYAGVAGDMMQTYEFLLEPDFSKLTAKTIMVAMGQAFFSVGLGMAVMISFGSYLPKNVSIPKSAAIIVMADTLVALLAGLAIFPLVFQYGLTPSGGPGLIFETLPVAFGQIPGGEFWGSLFFFLLITAALTSCIAGIESIVGWVEEQKNIHRKKSVLIVGFSVWLVGIASILSFNEWSDFYPLGFIPVFESKTIFDTFDFLAGTILLVIVVIFVAVFFVWRIPAHTQLRSLGVPDGVAFRAWRIIVQFAVPPVLFLLLLIGIS